MKKQRILFVNNSSKLGLGTSAHLLVLLGRLSSDFDFAVVSDRNSTQLPDALEKMAVRHYALPDRLVDYLPALVSLIVRNKYDLIYANGSNERSRGAFWASKITRRPLIWHIHESITTNRYAGTIRFADCVIANSRDTAARLTEYANVSRPIVIDNGIELEQHGSRLKLSGRRDIESRFGLSGNWLRVVNIGRVCRDKNQADAIRVARQVVTRFPRTYFLLVGDPETAYAAYLKNLVIELELQDHVLFTGYSPDANGILETCDLMLHVSKKESQGRVLLEAMAARLPVVAYRVGGVGDVVLDRQTGFLLPDGDVDGAARAVCRLLSDTDQRLRMGEAGYARIRQCYSAQESAAAIKAVIADVLARRQR